MKWVTWENVGVNRIGCAWLILRQIDPQAEFLFVPRGDSLPQDTEPFDVPGVQFLHHNGHCSFHALVMLHKLTDPCLFDLAVMVRGAETARPDLAPQRVGLFAISLGLSHNFNDDHAQLVHGFVLYDALYSWLKSVRNEQHDWNPQRRNP